MTQLPAGVQWRAEGKEGAKGDRKIEGEGQHFHVFNIHI